MIQLLHNTIIFALFFFPLCISAQNNGNVTRGATITANANSIPWLSPSGDFAFGFQQLPNTTDLFVLSIWFNRIPDQTIVWFDRNSFPVPIGSTLQLTAEQGLWLRDPRNRLLWNTTGFADEVAYGYMNDTGNFILFSGSNSSLWETFSFPADTILPTKAMPIGNMLNSRMSHTNFSQGRFYASMSEDGNFVFNTLGLPSTSNPNFDAEYYNSRTSDASALNSGYQVLFSDRGMISITRRNGQQVNLSPGSIPLIADNYYRATLDVDGVFTQYYHPRTFTDNPGWSIARSWPDNICISIQETAGSGACGYNSICTLRNQRPDCRCPQGFSLVDPNNSYGDCLPRFTPNCVNGENGSAFEMLEIHDTDWTLGDYEGITHSSDVDCRNACLEDCLCGASIYRADSNNCWKKKLPLSNGRIDSTLNATAFLKFRRGNVPELSPDLPTVNQRRIRDQRTLILVGSVLLGSSVFINFLLMAAACLGFFLIYKRKIPFFNSFQQSVGAKLRCFRYKELVQITNGFKEELGRGAFGIVYKGEIPDGSKSIVAVKRLDRVSEDSEKEFRAEVNTIGQTHHKNLVCLLGFCDEGANRLLVYEYMSNKTLADFLFGTSKRSWSMRCEIGLGVAKGLTYLHEECSTQIIHCDIKPQNILIDEYYNARISDFGLAKLLMKNQTRTLTNIRGTKGYVAPEWFRNTQITAKVDVYSFGVVLLEIISCKKNVTHLEQAEGTTNPILTDWVWDCFQENRLDGLVDDDMDALSDRRRLERFVMVGLWCIQEDASLRPSMKKVSQMLEGIVEVAMPPCPSPFSNTN